MFNVTITGMRYWFLFTLAVQTGLFGTCNLYRKSTNFNFAAIIICHVAMVHYITGISSGEWLAMIVFKISRHVSSLLTHYF